MSPNDHLSFTSFLDNILVDFPPQNPLVFSSSRSNDEISKNKRVISNRESARRSRIRKQTHLEDVKSKITRYKMVNHELMNRLRSVNRNGQIFGQENQRLEVELVMLQEKLYNLHNLLELHYTLMLPSSTWPCVNNNVTQNQLSLVTLL
ncbi:hypothetical protein SSX86_025226 [Deinandra increscens subsp. villosa]|uniref:BZIP domain-containing protein n=1 Tax=Deinandra increscens subsp. villosa TaxID=3103831 RepID=A0AAP0GN04_9ASTR